MARRSRTASAVGLALLFAAMAGAAWVSAGAIPGRSNGGKYVEVAALLVHQHEPVVAGPPDLAAEDDAVRGRELNRPHGRSRRGAAPG